MRNLYTELTEYTGRQQELVEARSIHASVELAWQFEKHKDNPIEHYKNTDLYLFASTRYQMDLQFHGFHDWFKDIIKQFGDWQSGLDLGGGIGEQTILAYEAGVEKMDFMEIEGSKSMEYARWRFEKHNVRPIFRSENYKIDQDYDFVVAMDVFEHMENPQPVIENIAKHTKYLFCNPDQIRYSWLFPQHISHFTLEPYFKQVKLYLYERRQND
jgi:2-polyprenyl-3-methyl-5-hydroxy-6-metoxy-1,4-benzoquinol methylase